MPKKDLPKISIITPSFNQGQFIEETIQSVLSQKYPNLEYLVMDGGSTDQTVSILKKYEKYLTWISEGDRGQSHAINKGLRICTGDIVAYLNTDDLYTSNSLRVVGEYFSTHSDAMWLTGKCTVIDIDGNIKRSIATRWKELWLYDRPFNSDVIRKKAIFILNFISQPSTFWRREMISKAGLFDENLHFVMDYDYWLRLLKHSNLHIVRDHLASFRIHPQSKSSTTYGKMSQETIYAAGKYTKNKLLIGLNYLHSGMAKVAFLTGI